MAAQSAARTVHATLGAGVADVVSLTGGGYDFIEVVNRDTAAVLTVTGGALGGGGFSGAAKDGVPTVGGARTVTVPPGRSRLIPLAARTPAQATQVCQILCASAAPYSVTGHGERPSLAYADRAATA